MQKNHSLKDWVIATRPWSFPASSMPVLTTVFILNAQHTTVHWWLGLWALVNIIFVHAAGNTWSDYFDYKRGVDREDTYGVKTITSGDFTPQQIFRLSLLLQVIAILMGIGLILLTGWTLLWIGIAGVCLSLLYPPLKYIALGDVVIMLCYAFLPMIGTSFITSGEIHWNVLWYSVPIGLITVAILHSNNTRDIETDQRAGIKTFSMLTGRAVAANIYCFEVSFPYVWMLLLCILSLAPWWAMISWVSLPLAFKNIAMMMSYKKQGIQSFAQLDEGTAKLQMAFSFSLILGLILASFF